MHMADTKALFTQRFDAARTAFSKGDEPAAAEALHSAIVVARSDPGLRRELASALFHLGKLSRKFGRAGEDEAERLLSEALAISEELFGREHAALAPLLNELGRLHVHRSQYTGAAGVLERLLAIARGKGEETADVATALAGLAVVKRKLGDDAAAEGLYRDALRIREKVLEPSDMATVVTLEHLSETCAARGNFDEALALYRRALTTREVVLGPGHATAQAARTRLAELELQVAVAADTAAAAAAKAARGPILTPAWLKRVPGSPAVTPSTVLPSPVNSQKLEVLKDPELRVLPSAAQVEPELPVPQAAAISRERAKTPTVITAVPAASLMASPIRTPAPSPIVISPSESARPFVGVVGGESSAPLPQHDAVLANIPHSGVASDAAPLGDWRSTIALVQSNLLDLVRKRRTVLYASVGVAAVAITGIVMLRPRTGGGERVAMAAERTTSTGAPVVTAPVRKTGYIADSLLAASAPSAPNVAAGEPEKRATDSALPELHAPRVKVQLRPINIPSVSVPTFSASTSPESIAPSATERPRASDTGRAGTGERASLATSLDVGGAVSPARIIGRPPEPAFPDALLRSGRREGQVAVRFIVNEFGRVDVSTMIVERSDDELFTSAVRDILPDFRFEPARTRAPESRPVATWVSVPFRFTTKKR